jgi:hypothetical protein
VTGLRGGQWQTFGNKIMDLLSSVNVMDNVGDYQLVKKVDDSDNISETDSLLDSSNS